MPADLRVVPLELAEANMLVSMWHRHHKPVVGHRFSLGAVTSTGTLVGAVIVGRPVARKVNHRTVVEVTRMVSNGYPNVCSFLYGAAARAAKAMGYEHIQTYILNHEHGTTLKAAGWDMWAISTGGGPGWQSRPGRRSDQPTETKQRWGRKLNDPPPLFRCRKPCPTLRWGLCCWSADYGRGRMGQSALPSQLPGVQRRSVLLGIYGRGL